MSLAANVAAAVNAAGGEPGDENDKNIQQWKIKKLIKSLELARGNGTSMISLIIPPKDQISRVTKMLAEEYGTASNIKSRVNRQSVLGAITSTQQRLKLYNRVPNNGLVLYCGMIQTDDGKERKVNIDFEPFKPINTSLYLCVDGDAIVATSSGMGRRLEDIVVTQNAELVYGSSNTNSNALCMANVTAFQNKGTRPCVRVTLRDGRALMCTPDHRLLVVRNGAPLWVEAGHLLKTDLAVCGPDAPVDKLGNPAELGWTLPGVGSLSDTSERARMLAFARLAGLLLTDGNLYWNQTYSRYEAAINVGHELDVASVQADIQLVCGTTCRVHLTVSNSDKASSVFKVASPLALAAMFGAAGLQHGDRRKQPAMWPAWILDEQTPLCVVREFVGGVMGGDGYAPCLNGDHLDHQKIFGQHCSLEFSDSMATKMQQFCKLLTRLGIDGAFVTTETVVWNGCESRKYVVRLPSTLGSLDFDEKVGFRHCMHKQARNTAASVYRRLYKEHIIQRSVFTELVIEERQAGAGRNAIKQAQAKMRLQRGTLLDETAIQMSYADLQKIEAGAEVARAYLPSFAEVMRDIGALALFTADKVHGLPRGKEFPVLLLAIRDVSPAGERNVFDISVDAARSFTANGVVVHNCDNKFHTEPLGELLESDEKFGFIVMDGSGTLFGTLAGNTREVLHRMTVDLPKKHGRGGQSALRFARLRLEKRHNYVRKVAELAVQFFITNDRPNVAGLVLAGLADFKTELSASDMFDPRLQAIVLKVVDVSYGGDNGFNQAIELAAEVLHNVKFIREKKLISQFFDEIAQDSGKYCFGVDDTLKALEIGAVESLLVYENLETQRLVLKNNSNGDEKIVYFSKEQMANQNNFRDEATGSDLETIESISVLEWFANNYKKFGAKLEIVTNRSQEGSQFVKGFGGIGGILRYKVEFNDFDEGAAAGEDNNPEDDFI